MRKAPAARTVLIISRLSKPPPSRPTMRKTNRVRDSGAVRRPGSDRAVPGLAAGWPPGLGAPRRGAGGAVAGRGAATRPPAARTPDRPGRGPAVRTPAGPAPAGAPARRAPV